MGHEEWRGARGRAVRIAYVSDILNVHDYRFLEKLSERDHDVWLITFSPRGEVLPAEIRRLPNIHVIHQQVELRSKWDPRRYRDVEGVLLFGFHPHNSRKTWLFRRGLRLLVIASPPAPGTSQRTRIYFTRRRTPVAVESVISIDNSRIPFRQVDDIATYYGISTNDCIKRLAQYDPIMMADAWRPLFVYDR
jgi:hypothetical protein